MSKHSRQHFTSPTKPIATPPPGAWWNAIARAWFTGSASNAERLDPQPPPPVRVAASSPLSGGPPTMRIDA